MKQFSIPILLEFYARPEKFVQVFNAIKEIKPVELYLYQDAPKSEKDIDGWKKCREIISTINWPCTIKTFFQEKNQGCDPSGFIAQSWFFDNVEYGIVLEDDCVPNLSFFYYCEELLLKYKDNDSIAFISGMNVLDKFENSRDREANYFFTAHGGIWGWASWRRFYKKCDPTYSWLNDKNSVAKIKRNFYSSYEAKSFLRLARARKKESKAYFETIVYANARLHNQLEIVPCVNLISNIGIGDLGTHGPNALEKLPPKIRKMFFKDCYDMTFPLNHPISFSRNTRYEKKIKPSIFDEIRYKFYSLKYRLFIAKRKGKDKHRDN